MAVVTPRSLASKAMPLPLPFHVLLWRGPPSYGSRPRRRCMRDLDQMDAFDVSASVSNSPPPGPVAVAIAELEVLVARPSASCLRPAGSPHESSRIDSG